MDCSFVAGAGAIVVGAVEVHSIPFVREVPVGVRTTVPGPQTL